MTPDYALLKRQNPISHYLSRNGIKIVHLKFSCVSPDHDDKNPSASIFDGDERWRCHGCEKGGDIIDLVMLHRGMDHAEAVRHLGGETWTDEPKPPPKKGSKPQLVRDFGTPPEDAPILRSPKVTLLKKSGDGVYTKTIDHLYEYRDQHGTLQAYVARIDANDEHGKDIFPIRWHLAAKQWTQAGFQKGEARPLFNEHKLAQRQGAEVLVVEGEKSAIFAEALFPEMVVVSWIGGTSNADKADYAPLKGRHVTLWRDNDDDGLDAMDKVARKANAAVLLTVPMDKDWPKAWDIVDIAQMPGAAEEAFRRRRPYTFDISPKGKSGAWSKISEGGWLPDQVRPIPGAMGQVKTTSASNAYFALLYHPMFATLGWDALQKRIVFNGQELTQGKLHFLHAHLNEVCGLEINQGFDKVVEAVAIERPLNRLAEMIRSTAWDKVKRVERLWTYFGVAESPWAVCGFKRWFLGHVARILNPGFKQDLILILEGQQGMGKSSALETLGNAFGYPGYARLASIGGGKMNDQDMMIIAGQTLIELGEMTAHRKADLDHFKDVTTRNSDKYRAPYSKDTMTVPRTASFAGTTNLTRGYLADPTGARRFVPMRCDLAIDLEGLKRDREQIYAEAALLLLQDELTYFVGEEEEMQEVEVEDRQKVDYYRARMSELVETTNQDFLPEYQVWAHLGIPVEASRERAASFDRVENAMLQLGWEYRRVTIDERRQWGFTRLPRKPGRRWNKVKLDPPG